MEKSKNKLNMILLTLKNKDSYIKIETYKSFIKLEDLQTEKQLNLEILRQNQKDLQTQVARIKQTTENIRDKDTTLAPRIRTLFCN